MPRTRRGPDEALKQSFVSKQLKKNYRRRRALFSQAPFPAQTERKTQDTGRGPLRQIETDFEKETGAQDKEWLQSLDYGLKDDGGWGWVRDLYLIRQSTQEVPKIKARGLFI